MPRSASVQYAPLDAGGDSSAMLHPPTPSIQSIEMRSFSRQTLPPPPPYSTMMPSEKPLPSPGLWGQVAMSTARARYDVEQRLPWLSRIQILGTGWRTTVGAGCGVAISVLFVNIVLLIWGSTKPWDPSTGTRTLAEGNCNLMQNVFTYSHLVINVLSTILLGTSNAAMQCLSAPTRESVDRAHAMGKWLDVGISGFRNWPHMDRWRKWCWMLLLLSTVPLHLLYNSAIFSTTTANEYWAIAVPSNFLDNKLPPTNVSQSNEVLYNMTQLAHAGRLVKKSNQDCINTYNQQLVTAYSNVLVVTKNISTEMPIDSWQSFPTPRRGEQGSQAEEVNSWICGDTNMWPPCNIDDIAAHSSTWSMTLTDHETWNNVTRMFEGAQYLSVDHCLLQPTTATCTIQFIPEIMIIVIICNAVKVACFLMAIRIRSFRPLITLGDALASFLNQPEPQTADLGPLSAADIRDAEVRARVDRLTRGRRPSADDLIENGTKENVNPIDKLPLRFGPWAPRAKRWFSGASRLRWLLTYALMIGMWLIGWTLFGFAATGENATDFAKQWAIGLGNVSPNLLLEFTAPVGVFGNVLLANVFQLLVSLTYLSYNGLFTCILISHEFTQFARRRTALRVSVVEGRHQRSSYWLSLPYQFAIPLLLLSGFLHWALSQSLFLAEIVVNGPNGLPDDEFSVSCLGYSTLALLITMMLGATMIISPVVLGWIRYRPGAPIVESNSFAISAACHPREKSAEEALELLKYGAFPDTDGERVGLSSGRVEPLVPGKRHTSREELDAQLLTRLSPAALVRTRWQIIWERILALLCTAKVVIFLVWFLVGSGLIPGYKVVVSGPRDWTIMTVCLALLGTYLLVRITVSIVRWRKKWNLRHIGWHIVPEAVWWLIWLVVLGLVAQDANPQNEAIFNGLYGPSTAVMGPVTNLNVDAAASLMVCFLLATGIEIWLWWQQHRVDKILPFLTPHAWRWVRFGNRHRKAGAASEDSDSRCPPSYGAR